jgi:hypothetical protein
MVGFAHPLIELSVLGLYVVVGAIVLTVTHAWAMGQTRGEPSADAAWRIVAK